MRPNRRPAGNACCRVLSLTACISSLGQSQTPTALAESDCTKAPWGIARRSMDEPYLRAELETATGVTGPERSLNSFSSLVPLHTRSPAAVCASYRPLSRRPSSQRFLQDTDRRDEAFPFSVGVVLDERMTCHIMRHEPFPRYASGPAWMDRILQVPIPRSKLPPPPWPQVDLSYELQGCVSIVTVVHECSLGSRGKSPHCRSSSGHDVRGQISVASAPVAPLIPRIPRAYEL